MATNANRAGFWNDQVWSSIDDGVTKAVGAIRVAQKVFPTVQLTGVTSVPADHFNPEKMSIAEGLTKPYLALARGVPFAPCAGHSHNTPRPPRPPSPTPT